jgi:FkbM family methyltransferase
MRLMQTLKFYAAAATPWKVSVQTRAQRSGLKFVTSTLDVVGRHLAKYGGHEAELTEWIEGFLKRSAKGVFVDVGANIGWHAVHAAKQSNLVVAFEPDAFNAWLLDQNVTGNLLDNVVVQQAAVGARNGTALLHRYKNSNRGRHSLISTSAREARTVPLVSLDAALETLGLHREPISLIKIDVEGYEPAVIHGARKALSRSQAVVTEVSPTLSTAGNLSIKDMAFELQGAGFRPNRLHEGRLAHADINTIEGQLDIIWLRQGVPS